MNKKTKERIANVIYFLCALFILWFILSYFNVIAHNMTDQDYAWWNCFDLFCKLRKG